MRIIVDEETSYHSSHGTYACNLSGLVGKAQGGLNGPYADLATGKHGGYVYVISGCDSTQYKVVAEPEMNDSGQRAFCADESGTIRFSTDGKATTCLSGQDTVGGA